MEFLAQEIMEHHGMPGCQVKAVVTKRGPSIYINAAKYVFSMRTKPLGKNMRMKIRHRLGIEIASIVWRIKSWVTGKEIDVEQLWIQSEGIEQKQEEGRKSPHDDEDSDTTEEMAAHPSHTLDGVELTEDSYTGMHEQFQGGSAQSAKPHGQGF